MIYRILILLLSITSQLLSAQSAWKTFASEELTSQVITVTLADRSGNLWLGTTDGLSVYNNGKWVLVDRIQDIESKTSEKVGYIVRMWEDVSGNIWLASKGKFFTFNGKFWVNYNKSLLPDYTVRFLLHDSRDDIWLCSEYEKSDKSDNIRSLPVVKGAVTRFNGLAWINYELEAGGSHYVQHGDATEFYTGLLEDSRGYIWIGSVQGLRIFTGSQWLVLGVETLPDEYVTHIIEAGNGDIWVSTTGGVGRFDGTAWEIFKPKDGIGRNVIRQIREDEDGRIWASITGSVAFQGLVCYDGGKWTKFISGKELPTGNILSSFDDFCRSDMILTRSGAAIFDGRGWYILGPQDGLAGDHFYSMAADANGKVWISSDKGLFIGDGKNFSPVCVPASGEWEITAMLHDSRSRTWLATADHEIFLEKDGQILQYYASDGIPDEDVRQFVEDESGRIWAIYRKAVALYEF